MSCVRSYIFVLDKSIVLSGTSGFEEANGILFSIFSSLPRFSQLKQSLVLGSSNVLYFRWNAGICPIHVLGCKEVGILINSCPGELCRSFINLRGCLSWFFFTKLFAHA